MKELMLLKGFKVKQKEIGLKLLAYAVDFAQLSMLLVDW